METTFWIDSWNEGGFKTSFHRPDIHPYVLRHLTPGRLSSQRVVVPLCGKSADLLHFGRHAQSCIGVELAEKAVHQFYEENGIACTRSGDVFEGGGVTILCTNFFDVTPAMVGHVDILYDRASLIALPDDMRARYVAKVHELTCPGTRQFVNTLEYEPVQARPPFTVTPRALSKLYAGTHSIRHLEWTGIPDHGLIRAWGLDYVIEHFFELTRAMH